MLTENNLRTRILGKWASWSSKYWGRALFILFIITAIMAIGVSILKLEMTIYSMLPNNSTQVEDMKQIMKEFPAASSILAVVDARGIENPVKAERMVKKTVDALTLELSKEKYSDHIVQVYGNYDMDFFRKHGFMFSKASDIKRATKLYSNLNLVPLLTHLNDDLEKEYSGDEDKLSDEEQMAVTTLRGLGEILDLLDASSRGETIPEFKIDSVLDSYLFGESYFLSNDNRMGIVLIEPTFTIEDYWRLTDAVNEIERASKSVGKEFGIDVGLTGMAVIGRDEMVTSEQGLALSSFIAFILIILLLVLVFRMYSVPLISGIPLLIGIFWTIGMSGFIIKRLNIMTAMYMIALLGLGIDYAIHLLSSFIQERDGGVDFSEAIKNAVIKSGSGILTGGITSATAFFALIFSETLMIKELGFVAGMGIMCELIAMLMFIPPLLGLREYRLRKKGITEHRVFTRLNIRSDVASVIGKLLVKTPITFALVMLSIGIFFTFSAPKVSLETNLMEMEAKGLESIILQDTLVEEFGMAPDYLSLISEDLEEIKKLGEKLKKLSSVKTIESLGTYYVSDREMEDRRGELNNFLEILKNNSPEKNINKVELLNQLYRLEANLLELGDMAYLGSMFRLLNTIGSITGINNDGIKVSESSFDSLYYTLEKGATTGSLVDFQNSVVKILQEKLLNMSSVETVSINMLPESLKKSYISRDGTKHLMSIIPTKNPWAGDFRYIYKKQIETITNRGTGMILAADQLAFMAEKDGVRAAIIALIVVFFILLLDFRNIKLVILTLASLLLTFLTLLGFMALAGIKFDFLNIIVVPLLIGIGVDNAVHINHRYLYEGLGEMRKVIGKTGTALLLTSLTTIIGFASFIPSVMRAMRSTGIVLSIAMAITFLYSVLFHPAFLIIITEKLGLNIKPWRKK